jgi:hypothetical protein
MTAPGNDAVLITLLATLTAGAGYVAGRLHQWYRTVLDRDEAYRDGYDTATRSVFGMAARMIRPSRGVRASAAVSSPPPASPAVSSPAPGSPAFLAVSSPSAAVSSPYSAAPSSPADSAAHPADSAGSVPHMGEPSPAPAATEPTSMTVPTAVGTNPARHFSRSSSAGGAARRARPTPSAAAMSEAVLNAAGLPGRPRVDRDPVADHLVGPAAGRDPVADRLVGPTAGRDRAAAAEVPVAPEAGRDPAPAADRPFGSAADRFVGPAADRPGESPADHGASTEDDEGTAGGRHFVRDELVQAATYRLTPDRVARAKVREVITGDEEGQETTRLPSVPRPRSS